MLSAQNNSALHPPSSSSILCAMCFHWRISQCGWSRPPGDLKRFGEAAAFGMRGELLLDRYMQSFHVGRASFKLNRLYAKIKSSEILQIVVCLYDLPLESTL